MRSTPTRQRHADRAARAVMDPIVLPTLDYPIPVWLAAQIRLERLERCDNATPTVATEAETLAYLYSASFLGPMRTEFVDIYQHLLGRYAVKAGLALPPELPDIQLDDRHLELFADLRRALGRAAANAARRGRRPRKPSQPEGTL